MIIGYDASRAFLEEKTGTETYSYQLLKALLGLGSPHHLRVYTRGAAGDSLEPGSEIPEEPGSFPRQRVEFIPINWSCFWTQGGLALETWRNPPDVLFIPAHIVPLAKNPKVPVVVTVHDLAIEFLPQYSNWLQKFYLGWWMERLRARRATHLIAVSEATRKDIIEKLLVSDEKVSVVYEGVSNNFQLPITNFQTEEVKKKYKIEGDYILFVGTVQPRKNLVRLIEAFSVIEEKGQSLAMQLVIAGKPGWNCAEIFAAPQEFGVGDRVNFLNYVSAEDLSCLYAGAKMLCLPSLHEGFGLPVLEVMMAGIPAVASRCSSLPEVGGAAAVYIDPFDVNDIARGILEVLHWDAVQYSQKVKEGKEWAAQFTWERAAKETLAVLEQVVS